MPDTETYSNDGPICPYCGHEHTTDGEPFYYNDSNDKMECEDCRKEFKMMIYHSTSWSCERMDDGEDDSE